MQGEFAQGDRLRLAGYASVAAGSLHAVAAGLHAEHPNLLRIFLVMALVQTAWGIVATSIATMLTVTTGAMVNIAAVGGWVLTRTTGIAFVPGLEIAESPQPADTVCAALAALSLVLIVVSVLARTRPLRPSIATNAAYFLAALSLIGVWNAQAHTHSHGTVKLVDGGLTIDANGVIISPGTTVVAADGSTTTIATTSTTSGSSTSRKSTRTSTTTTSTTTTTPAHSHNLTTAQAQALASGWPRAFDPTQPIDFSGIGGVTAVQAARATALIQNTARDLARYANYADAIAAGYFSIGDSGFEHLIKSSYLNDGRFLDTTAPESLVYKVANGTKTLVSAMFIANPGTQVNDATINDYAGGLIQWHVHNNLCWRLVNGVPKVVGVLDSAGNCPIGSTLQTGGAPMVHVWITAHPCGPFAAVEGVAAGISDVPDAQRVDLCNAAH